jgi:hypothetical protein
MGLCVCVCVSAASDGIQGRPWHAVRYLGVAAGDAWSREKSPSSPTPPGAVIVGLDLERLEITQPRTLEDIVRHLQQMQWKCEFSIVQTRGPCRVSAAELVVGATHCRNSVHGHIRRASVCRVGFPIVSLMS